MIVLTLLGVAFLSALIPVVNLEVYLGGMALLGDSRSWWEITVLSGVAAVGQMVGKTLFYFVGRGVITLPRRLRTPAVATGDKPPRPRQARIAARMVRWQQQVEQRPWLSVGLVGVSASVGVPPFALVSVAAGALRIPLAIFLVAGLIGRWARFAFVLAVVQVSTG